MDNELIMTIETLVNAIAEPVIIALGAFIVYFVKKGFEYFQTKLDNECAVKYLEMAKEIVIDCVTATNQSYVDSLKSNGAFNQDAWVTAFEKTKNNVLKLLSDAQKEVITELYGDLDGWINTQIEARVRQQKLEANAQKAPSQIVNISQTPVETVVEDIVGAEVVMSE